MPAFWFRQKADLPDNLASLAKILVLVPSLAQDTGYGFIALGVLIGAIGAYITYRRGWLWSECEEEELLSENGN